MLARRTHPPGPRQPDPRDDGCAVPASGQRATPDSDRGSWAEPAGIDGSGAQLTPNAVTGIASITKTFLASEVMKLAGEGRLRRDAPLSTYVADPAAGNGATVALSVSSICRSIRPGPPKVASGNRGQVIDW